MTVNIKCPWYWNAILTMTRSGVLAAISQRVALHVPDQQFGRRRGIAAIDEGDRCLGHRVRCDVAENDVSTVRRFHKLRHDRDATAEGDVPQHRDEISVALDHARNEFAGAGDGFGEMPRRKAA
jgi:hypothetical protein